MSDRLTTEISIDKSILQTRAFIYTPNPELWAERPKEVIGSLILKTGDCSVHCLINAKQTELLIANLQQHLQNIKTLELNLLAENSKTAVAA